MAFWQCKGCKGPPVEGNDREKPWIGPCPNCGRFRDAKRVGADSVEHIGTGMTTLGGKHTKSSQQYISTGQPGYDWVCGGGILAGRVHLLGGFAGAGKTRLLLVIADYIAKTQGRVIYASGEESAADVLSNADSLGLVNDRVIVLGNQSCVEDVLEEAKKLQVFLTVLDSAQEFVSNTASGGPGSGSQCKAIGKVVKNYCGVTKTCSIIVNQMSSAGDLKGGTELEHKCDTINVLAFPREGDEDAPGSEADGYRALYNHNKNRGGIANRKSFWRMTDAGRLEHVPPKSSIIDLNSRRGKYSKHKDEGP